MIKITKELVKEYNPKECKYSMVEKIKMLVEIKEDDFKMDYWFEKMSKALDFEAYLNKTGVAS